MLSPFSNRYIISAFFLLLLHSTVFAQAFSELQANFRGAALGSGGWCDYNNDGLLDVFEVGTNLRTESTYNLVLYKNKDAGTFQANVIKNAPLVIYGKQAWGDYNNDGWPDLIMTGTKSGFNTENITKLYRNKQDGSFEEVNTNFPGVQGSDVSWLDFDNDGDWDILITGISQDNTQVLKIFENTSSGFIDSGINLASVEGGRGNFTASRNLVADFDNDGYQDLVVAESTNSAYKVNLFRNQGNKSFVMSANSQLPQLNYASLSAGDINNDGLMDLLISGSGSNPVYNNSYGATSYVLINAGNLTFTATITFEGVYWGNTTLGDYDNDGWLDVLQNGSGNGKDETSVYQNSKTGFTKINSSNLAPAALGNGVQWGDYDSDGDLDFLITGTIEQTQSNALTKVYTNTSTKINNRPSIPQNLKVNTSNGQIVFSWDRSNDIETPQKGLTYNIRIGTTPGGAEIVSDLAISTGAKNLEGMGNCGLNNFYILKNLPNATYYWDVQAVDNSYYESGRSPEQISSVPNVIPQLIPDENPELTFVNIITPNNDGLNETFVVNNLMPDCKLQIYNRYGQIIYLTDNYKNDWGSNKVTGGVYYYLLTNKSDGKSWKGWLEVVY